MREQGSIPTSVLAGAFPVLLWPLVEVADAVLPLLAPQAASRHNAISVTTADGHQGKLMRMPCCITLRYARGREAVSSCDRRRLFMDYLLWLVMNVFYYDVPLARISTPSLRGSDAPDLVAREVCKPESTIGSSSNRLRTTARC